MKIFEIYSILDKLAPFSLQEAWDNSGIQIGSMDTNFERIYLSLDLSDEILDKILPNSLILTHHPLIFKGLKALDFNTYPSSLISKMMRNHISLISLHTNYDKVVLNDYFVTQILGFEIDRKDDFLAYCDVDMKFDELVKLVKEKMELKYIRCVKAKDEIKTIAVCTGSGMDLAENLQADTFLTGDIKYHQALQAKENRLGLIDIGHYESERYFGLSLIKYLQNFKIEVIICDFKNPFTHY
ncbi:MAG: Nif3-like dinuclear metal center hexameric protein [Campylobacter sp.]